MKASLFENLFLESGSVECETEDYIYSGVCGNLNNIRDNRRESSPCAEEDLIGEIVADASDYERGNEGDKIARVYYLVLFRSERQDDNGLIITVAMTHMAQSGVRKSGATAPQLLRRAGAGERPQGK